MASRRSLGGGRVLGNGHSKDKRHQHLLSPSESSASLSSQVSLAPLSVQDEDLASRAASRAETPVLGQSTSSAQLVCPICAEEMVTLLQLNRHLDDNHQNLEEVEQDEVKNWFEQQVRKAKKFQPLAILNQRLRGLDVFEPNNTTASPPPPPRPSSRQSSPAPDPRPLDPDELITKTHWQRPGSDYDLCADPACGRRLGTSNGSVNCRHCGRLFCDEHTMYQMRLSRSANHDPVRGFWSRVCETCYKSRLGYNDHTGYERSITKEFLSARKRVVDKATLEVSRLEKRLTKLTQLLANPPSRDGEQQNGPAGFLWSFAGRGQARALEQTVVAWEDDASVSQCPFCHQPFTQYTFRRHHCRICGRVVCADVDTACSQEVGLQVEKSAQTCDQSTDKRVEQIPVDVRMCKECQHTLFSRSDFAAQVAQRPPDQRAYEHLSQFEAGIRLLLPKFQRLLQTLQNLDASPSPAQMTEATKIRKRLTESFTKLDTAARRIRDLPTDSPTQQRLNKAVYAHSAAFLHLHMLPLKQLPKVLRSAAPSGIPGRLANGRHTGSPLSAIRLDSDSRRRDSSASTSTTNSAALTALESEERELRECMIVLEEQRYLVQEMVNQGKKKRRFDEVAALSGNLDDLNREIDGLHAQLQGMDWQGAYSNDLVIDD